MRKHLGTTIRFTAGVVFLVLGVVGSLLPVLQGWIFFLLAALMFFPNHPRAERAMVRLQPRMPRLVGWLRRLGFGKLPEDEIGSLDLGELVHPHSPHRTEAEPVPPEESSRRAPE